jgi:hypothetical protein
MTVLEALVAYGRRFGEVPPLTRMPILPDETVALLMRAIERGSPLTHEDFGA